MSITSANMKLRSVWLISGIVVLVALAWRVGSTAVAKPLLDPIPPANAPDWSEPELISFENFSAYLPRVVTSPVDDTVLVVFTLQTGALPTTTDPYYMISRDKGQSWATPFAQAIYVSAGARSLEVNAAIGTDGKAHAVWIENLALVYSHEDNWGNAPTLISSGGSIGATNPILVATGSNILDVVWSEVDTSGSFDVKHARSVDGGATWNIRSNVAATALREDQAMLAIDPANPNRLHIVYESGPSLQRSVFYTQGTIQGSSVSWSAPIQLSADNSKDQRPDLALRGPQILVTYTHIDTYDGSDYQLVFGIGCAQNCTQRSSWGNTHNLSGTYLTVNETLPFFIMPTMAQLFGCHFVYYHGVNTQLSVNERLYGVNSCANWHVGGTETLTPVTSRAINPDVAAHADGWLYMAYELYRPETDKTVVQFIRGLVPEPGFALYLPVIVRN